MWVFARKRDAFRITKHHAGLRMSCRFRDMTENLVRYQRTGDLHLITFSCYQRMPYLGLAEARDIFECSLETMRVRYSFLLTGYVVMPEHVHLLISEPKREMLADALKALKLSVAKTAAGEAFLDAAILRLQCIFGEQTGREAQVYSLKSGDAGVGGVAQHLAVVKFSALEDGD